MQTPALACCVVGLSGERGPDPEKRGGAGRLLTPGVQTAANGEQVCRRKREKDEEERRGEEKRSQGKHHTDGSSFHPAPSPDSVERELYPPYPVTLLLVGFLSSRQLSCANNSKGTTIRTQDEEGEEQVLFFVVFRAHEFKR
ncbi:hypothetical protein EYF80_011085 [Liparis tanakae]|uniref:Uncharacterized protein n=1 Tax=Liparis tanakae TaxID=230148 RepID=A0A4Z2ILL3_9TELE|nr:hypothetical protein EYF80_011085 [Liparis tanakae]